MKKLWLFLVVFSSLLQGMEVVDVEKGLLQTTDQEEQASPKKFARFMNNAKVLLTKVEALRRQYTDEEVSKTLNYLHQLHPTEHDIFLKQLHNEEISEEQLQELTIQFLMRMHEFRWEKSKERKEQKNKLEGVVETKEKVIKKDKWWKLGLSAGALAAGFLAGLAPFFESISGDAVEAACNCTMAAM